MVRDDEQPRAAHAELGGEGLTRPIERDMIGVDATGVLYEFGAEGTATNRVRGTRAATGAQGQRDASLCPEEERYADVGPEFAPVAPVFGRDLERGVARTAARFDGQGQAPQRRGAAGGSIVERPAVVLDLFDGQDVGCFKISYNDGSQAFEFLCPACW